MKVSYVVKFIYSFIKYLLSVFFGWDFKFVSSSEEINGYSVFFFEGFMFY